jgi:hypothetical protein
MLLFIPLPIVEISAHFSSYVIRIFEFEGEHGRGIRRLGLLALFQTPLAMWSTAAVSVIWAIPTMICLMTVAICGHALERIEDSRLAHSSLPRPGSE